MLFRSVLIFSLFTIAPAFSQKIDEADVYYVNVQILKIFTHSDGYYIIYRRAGLKHAEVFIPKSWLDPKDIMINLKTTGCLGLPSPTSNPISWRETFSRIPEIIFWAYIDFSSLKEKSRDFIPLLLELNKNVLPIIAFSASKTFTGYGMRTGATLCITKDKTIAQEFKQVNEYSSRGSWSNSPALGQMIISKIYEDKDLMKAVSDETH